MSCSTAAAAGAVAVADRGSGAADASMVSRAAEARRVDAGTDRYAAIPDVRELPLPWLEPVVCFKCNSIADAVDEAYCRVSAAGSGIDIHAPVFARCDSAAAERLTVTSTER